MCDWLYFPFPSWSDSFYRNTVSDKVMPGLPTASFAKFTYYHVLHIEIDRDRDDRDRNRDRDDRDRDGDGDNR